MDTLYSGQRWISETEPELGLGTLLEITGRTMVIRFAASDCVREYTLAGSPVKRMIFKIGDKVQLKDKSWMTINNVAESDGLVYYFDEIQTICETDLADTLSFSLPQDRLFAGILDASRLFDLRFELLESMAAYNASSAKGFIGGQVELIPHQFFIADSVTSRHLPRVLLADETGLGKTIEACLIIHKLLLTGRAQRVLIILPESLSHQWFIELYRRFNLSFMIFSNEYCSELTLTNPGINPFLEHQLGIVSISDLTDSLRKRQIKEAGWDMVVIDEAHHITDYPGIYRYIQTLVEKTKGLMLLTATPEQMGLKIIFQTCS
jgi:ATP-dependent helicase HepA